MSEMIEPVNLTEKGAFPVFNLSAPQHNQEFVVLEGDGREALIFGPGRSTDGYLPSDCKTVVIHGNRHFKFLKNINLNDQIVLSDQFGYEYQYCVLDVSIVDMEDDGVSVNDHLDELKLVTPWPFDGRTRDSQLRYVVTARKYETYQY